MSQVDVWNGFSVSQVDRVKVSRRYLAGLSKNTGKVLLSRAYPNAYRSLECCLRVMES